MPGCRGAWLWGRPPWPIAVGAVPPRHTISRLSTRARRRTGPRHCPLRTYGLIHVDYRAQRRTMKASGHWYRRTIARNGGE
ncbi:glycosyl hydrolase family protein [Nonomuraea diastatica]|uniref:Glycosyl hydrolase family protein n=1 Tax=Nonomuraea diastatica TaxID=1848329 RepID=A0A4R4W2Y7_9ACTN|nr:glycosyl hydrolase family protein [Nonomuraea diastatica]